MNCSQKNSTHRIITNVYTLKSIKPSENKPQKFHFKSENLYGVFQIKKIDPNIKWLIIHMPFLQPLCNFTMVSDDYYQIPFDKEVINIPFRRENTTIEEVTINHVIQGSFVDEETLYFSSKYYTIDFNEIPVALILVRTFNDQYSVVGIDKTKQTLIDYGDNTFKMLALEYDKDQIILIASSLIIIDDQHPLTEKTIPDFPIVESVIYHVWCERADEILVHDQTTGITIENNTLKDGEFFRIRVTPSHIIDFIPICTRNLSQSMCYFRQTFTDNNGYAIFRYPDKNGITILDTSVSDLFEQEDRQGLIEEVIDKNKSFYYITPFNEKVQIIRTYKTQLDLQLRIIEVEKKYRKFCIYDPDGYIIPVSRSYYTDDYVYFMEEFGIQNTDEQYYDFKSGDDDSCIYATYTSIDDPDINETDINDTNINDTDYADIDDRGSSKQLLSNEKHSLSSLPNPSIRICDIAKSLRVTYYNDISVLIPPATFNFTLLSIKKVFEEDWKNNLKLLNYEINEYFVKVKLYTENEANNSIYLLNLPYNEVVYNNTLKDDEYITANKDIIINYKGGILNYFLPKNRQTIIKLDDLDEINLNIYGNGQLKFKTKNKSKITIKGTLNINSTTQIQVDNDIKLVEIENVTCVNYSEFDAINTVNEKVLLHIKNLILLEHSKVNLTHAEILETIQIKQTATAIFDSTVIYNDAELLIEIIAYQNDLIPMMKGELTEPPKSIVIKRITEDKLKNLEEYIIFDGIFDCQTWVDKINYDNSYFNTARCTDNNSKEAHILNIDENGVKDEKRAFISFTRQPPPDPIIIKEKYMPGGLIAIIVFSVFDFIILILIIIFSSICCCCPYYLPVGNSADECSL